MSIIWDLSHISALNTNLVHEVHWYKKLYGFFSYYIQVYVMMFFQSKFLPGFSLSVLPATLSSSRPQCLHIRAIHFNPNLSILNPPTSQCVHLLSSAQSHPQCVYLLWPCAPTNIPLPLPPPVPSVLSLPIPPSPFPPPCPSSLPRPSLLALPFSPSFSLSLSVCLTSVSFPRALWCLRIRCSRTSSWSSSSPPTPLSPTSQRTLSLTSAYRRPSLSHVADYLPSTAGTTQSVSVCVCVC